MDLINQEELGGFTIRTLDILQYKVATIVWHTNHVYPDKNFRYVVSISSKFQYLDPIQSNMITFFQPKLASNLYLFILDQKDPPSDSVPHHMLETRWSVFQP